MILGSLVGNVAGEGIVLKYFNCSGGYFLGSECDGAGGRVAKNAHLVNHRDDCHTDVCGCLSVFFMHVA